MGAIGHVAHGKSTLAAALKEIFAENYNGCTGSLTPFDDYTSVQYSTDKGDYNELLDVPTRADFIDGTIKLDLVYLVVAANDGPMPETRQHLELVCKAGVSNFIVFISKCDLVEDEEAVTLVEEQVRGLLSEFKVPGPENVPTVRGSASEALHGSALGASQDNKAWEAKILEVDSECWFTFANIFTTFC